MAEYTGGRSGDQVEDSTSEERANARLDLQNRRQALQNERDVIANDRETLQQQREAVIDERLRILISLIRASAPGLLNDDLTRGADNARTRDT